MKNSLLFFFLIIYTIVLGLVLEEFLNINKLAMSTIAEQLTKEQLTKVLELNERWKWLSYGVIPIILLIKTHLIATVINIGSYFYDYEISYSKVYNIVLKSEFIFLLAIFAKGARFYLYQPDFTILDFQNFYPLSMLNIVDYKSLDPWMIYPFQTLNLFEVGYVLLLTFFMKKALNIKFLDSFLLIAISYGTSLLLWITTVMFIILNYS
jgi:hypothetical protein